MASSTSKRECSRCLMVMISQIECQSRKTWHSEQLSEHPASSLASQCCAPGNGKQRKSVCKGRRTWQCCYSDIVCVLDTRCITYLVKIFLQLLDTTHVVLVFNTQGHSLRVSTRTIKLKGSWVSVDIIQQKLCCILSQQP